MENNTKGFGADMQRISFTLITRDRGAPQYGSNLANVYWSCQNVSMNSYTNTINASENTSEHWRMLVELILHIRDVFDNTGGDVCFIIPVQTQKRQLTQPWLKGITFNGTLQECAEKPCREFIQHTPHDIDSPAGQRLGGCDKEYRAPSWAQDAPDPRLIEVCDSLSVESLVGFYF